MSMEYSVIIPVKDGMEYIDYAIESILKQSFHPAKIIVVDDHSEDGTFDHISSNYKDICLVSAPNQGQQAALNFGLNFVDTNLISFLDADDYWVSDKQMTQIDEFRRRNDADVICSGTRNFLNSNEDKRNFTQNTKDFRESRQFSACTFKTEVLTQKFPLKQEVGHFQWQISWWANAVDNNLNFVQTGKIHLNRRIHNSNSWSGDSAIGNKQLIDFIRSHKSRNQ